MKKKFKSLPILICLFVASCSSLEPLKISNSNDDQPDWVGSNQVTFIKNNKLFAVGEASAIPEARSSALFRVSDANAKNLLFQKVTTAGSYKTTGSELGIGEIGSYDFEMTEETKLTLSNIEVNERYWRIVKVLGSDGEEKVIKVAYSLVSLDLKTIKKKVKALNANN